jgi:hypothetical protein
LPLLLRYGQDLQPANATRRNTHMSLGRHRIVLIVALGLSLTAVGFAGAVVRERRPEPTEPTPESNDPLEAPWRELWALDSRDAGR